MRPKQWTKNLLCYAGALFAGRLLAPDVFWAATQAVLAFCLASSATYIFNDIVDRDRDRQHPRKRNRPIAAGDVPAGFATVLAVVMIVAALLWANWLDWRVLTCVGLYVINNLLYSTRLKHTALLDVISIAVGFCLRLLAGTYAVHHIYPDVLPSTWIVLCSFFLALFLGFSKRRAELNSLSAPDDAPAAEGGGGNGGAVGAGAGGQRPVLAKYSLEFLDYLVTSSATITVVCYGLFTTTSDKNPALIVTLPVVYYAVMYYNKLVVIVKRGEEPESILLRDRVLQGSIIVWFVLYFLILKLDPELFQRPDGPAKAVPPQVAPAPPTTRQ